MSGHLQVVEPFVCGLELGRINAPAALAILNRTPGATEQAPVSHTLIYLHRWPAGTAYPLIVRAANAIMHLKPIAPDDGRRFDPMGRVTGIEVRTGMAAVVVNATGVGRAALELLRDVAPDLRTVATWVTTGDLALEVTEGWRVPQRDLVAAVQVLQEQDRLDVDEDLDEYADFVEQMDGFKVERGPRGRDTYDPEEGAELVMAVALAAWWGELVSPGRVELVADAISYQEALASEIRKRRRSSGPLKRDLGPSVDGIG